jgi:hypothetical protein
MALFLREGLIRVTHVLFALMKFSLLLRPIVAMFSVVSLVYLMTLKGIKYAILVLGRCMIAYRHHGNRLGAVRCPVCRQQVSPQFAKYFICIWY